MMAVEISECSCRTGALVFMCCLIAAFISTTPLESGEKPKRGRTCTRTSLRQSSSTSRCRCSSFGNSDRLPHSRSSFLQAAWNWSAVYASRVCRCSARANLGASSARTVHLQRHSACAVPSSGPVRSSLPPPFCRCLSAMCPSIPRMSGTRSSLRSTLPFSMRKPVQASKSPLATRARNQLSGAGSEGTAAAGGPRRWPPAAGGEATGAILATHSLHASTKRSCETLLAMLATLAALLTWSSSVRPRAKSLQVLGAIERARAPTSTTVSPCFRRVLCSGPLSPPGSSNGSFAVECSTSMVGTVTSVLILSSVARARSASACRGSGGSSLAMTM
mmetsp:Transcript_27267/g.77078  ORF Transcript_27267/g.77078 Transcript_27267/m.77078 type:complete len:333 (+) Transcript_27267:1-999(+)